MGNGAIKPSTKSSTKNGASSSGRSFNQLYTLGDELGSGAFSIVKRGYYKKTGDTVAVKVVTKKKLTDDDLIALQMEIQILNSLDHPRIIKLYETFDEGSEIYIITEVVEGGELFDRIVLKTNYTEKEARDLIKTLLETVDYMADNNIVHRDMKPENILLCADDDDSAIKIADFGFAKRVKDLTGNETPCGTPGYVAPEILRGDRYGTEVDVWSLGVICYVLLAGYPPFYDKDQKKLFRKIKEGRYCFHDEYWESVSEEAIDMIKKMICVSQKNRWTAKQLLQHPWILKEDESLANKSLTASIDTMKKFNARRRFRAAIETVLFTQRLTRQFSSSKSKTDSGKSFLLASGNSIQEMDCHVPNFVNTGTGLTTEEQKFADDFFENARKMSNKRKNTLQSISAAQLQQSVEGNEEEEEEDDGDDSLRDKLILNTVLNTSPSQALLKSVPSSTNNRSHSHSNSHPHFADDSTSGNDNTNHDDTNNTNHSHHKLTSPKAVVVADENTAFNSGTTTEAISDNSNSNFDHHDQQHARKSVVIASADSSPSSSSEKPAVTLTSETNTNTTTTTNVDSFSSPKQQHPQHEQQHEEEKVIHNNASVETLISSESVEKIISPHYDGTNTNNNNEDINDNNQNNNDIDNHARNATVTGSSSEFRKNAFGTMNEVISSSHNLTNNNNANNSVTINSGKRHSNSNIHLESKIEHDSPGYNHNDNGTHNADARIPSSAGGSSSGGGINSRGNSLKKKDEKDVEVESLELTEM